MKALLLSGGLDSSALAWWLRPDLCVTVDYGQRAAGGELASARAICDALGLRHEVVRSDLRALGTGTMADRPASADAAAPEFWPYRNQMLVTLAAMQFQPEGLREVWVGAVSTDLHADGKLAFFRALDRAMRIQEGHVRVKAPASGLTSPDLLRRSHFPRELVGLTFSCHVHEYACGQCNGCLKHTEVVGEVFEADQRDT
jgi:7-cyano-7-deazaguanine synthase